MTDALWSYSVGLLPHKVTAYEDAARKLVVYLKWRVAGDWTRKSLGFRMTRDRKGRVVRADEDRARRAADAQYARLIAGGVIPAAPVKALTIAEGWALAIDADRGRWTADTPHRKEMARAIDRAKSVWGAGTAWNVIDRGEVRRLWRAELKRVRAQGKDGARSAEIVVSRVMTVAAWLREESKIAPTACVTWEAMRGEMAADIGRVDVKRPRFTLEEYRALLAAAWHVDERFGLLLDIGAEYRLGQVRRLRRRDVDLEAGTFVIAGAGRKRGAVVQLTEAQRERLTVVLSCGYLAGLEAAFVAGKVADYPVFVGGHLPIRAGQLVTRPAHSHRGHLDRTPLRRWLLEAQTRAGITPAPGRGWYGLRRVAVDAAKEAGISREGLQQSGGWSTSQVPDGIYADQKMTYATAEAARVRSQIRGELPASIPDETDQTGTQTQNGAAGAAPSH